MLIEISRYVCCSLYVVSSNFAIILLFSVLFKQTLCRSLKLSGSDYSIPFHQSVMHALRIEVVAIFTINSLVPSFVVVVVCFYFSSSIAYSSWFLAAAAASVRIKRAINLFVRLHNIVLKCIACIQSYSIPSLRSNYLSVSLCARFVFLYAFYPTNRVKQDMIRICIHIYLCCISTFKWQMKRNRICLKWDSFLWSRERETPRPPLIFNP